MPHCDHSIGAKKVSFAEDMSSLDSVHTLSQEGLWMGPLVHGILSVPDGGPTAAE